MCKIPSSYVVDQMPHIHSTLLSMASRLRGAVEADCVGVFSALGRGEQAIQARKVEVMEKTRFVRAGVLCLQTGLPFRKYERDLRTP